MDLGWPPSPEPPTDQAPHVALELRKDGGVGTCHPCASGGADGGGSGSPRAWSNSESQAEMRSAASTAQVAVGWSQGPEEQPCQGFLRASPGDGSGDAAAAPEVAQTGAASMYVLRGEGRRFRGIRRIQLTRHLAKYPGCCVVSGLSFVTLVITLGIVSVPMDVETNFDAFLKTDVESNLKRSAFYSALNAKTSSRRLHGTSDSDADTVLMSKDLLLAYELTGPAGSTGLFRSKAMSAILRFEQGLRELPGWRAICGRAAAKHRRLCDPGISLVNYVLPSLELRSGSVVPALVTMDGQGWDALPMRTALKLASRHNLDRLFLPTNLSDGQDPRQLASSLLRSAFRFAVPCCSTRASLSQRRAAAQDFNAEWHNFSTNVLMPRLRKGPEGLPIRVWYAGSDFQEFEVKQALAGDMSLAIVSMMFVLAYLLVHTRSLLLSFLGPVIALLSVPLTYVVCAVFFGATTVSFANFLSLFLVVGFGADVIFVYTDFWRASRDKAAGDVDRLAWTFQRASKASFATTATTSLSFLANLASAIRALRQFGFFMGLCVMLTWVLISLIYAPLCVLDERLRRQCCRSGPRPSRALWDFGAWTRLLNRRPRCVCAAAAFSFAVFLGTAVPSVKVGSGLPSIFPEGHNQNLGRAAFDEFEAASKVFGAKFEAPPAHMHVCAGSNFTEGSWCDVHWCEAGRSSAPREAGRGGACDCMRSYRSDCNGQASNARVAVRLVGTGELPQHEGKVLKRHLERTNPHLIFHWTSTQQSSNSPPLIIQDWETGNLELQEMVKVEAVVSSRGSSLSCGWQEMCFCDGTLRCRLEGWNPVATTLHLSAGRRLGDGAQAKVSASRRGKAKVRVVFGLWVDTRVPLLAGDNADSSWTFIPSFDLKQPWVQRNLFAFCRRMPRELLVTHQWCWMADFRDFLTRRGQHFPVRANRFQEAATAFIESSGAATSGTRYLWLHGHEIKAWYASIEVGFSPASSPEFTLEYKAKWDAHLHRFNREAVKSARGAFHVSKLWVQAEAHGQLISSTLQTMLILLILASLGMIAITGSCALSLYVVVATLFVLSSLIFFVCVVMSWKVGLIEVIAIIYFIGYALDYSLHIAHKYASGEALEGGAGAGDGPPALRLRRTSFALRSIGSATFGSAVTTAGASLFLTFCTLTIFRKLGTMCLIVTVASIVTALVPLPAALLAFGPVRPGHRCGALGRRFRGRVGFHAKAHAGGCEPQAKE